jgi:hypothetical protein
MSNLSPSTPEWKDLYRAAIEFKQIECWNWMEDSDLFGVQNPEDGEIGYCCVLGALGEVFGLAVYLGAEGLNEYLKVQSGEIAPEDFDAVHQRCLLASFEDRRLLQRPDLEVIKKLGLRFRGPKSWSLFRSYQPGYYPWYLNKKEAMFLTIALQQAREVAIRLKKTRDWFNPPSKNHCLVRMADQTGIGCNWKGEWVKLPTFEKQEIEIPPIDEVRLQRIKKMASHKPFIWEGDLFYALLTIHKGGRPYFPFLSFWVDHQSRYILKGELLEHLEYRANFQEQFLRLLESVRFLPQEVRVKREEVFKLLEPITTKLEVKLMLVQKLSALEEAQKATEDFFLKKK